MDISIDNYESWFMDYIDGRLDAGQEAILLAFLEINPDLKQELEGLETVNLDMDEITYDLKAALRKPVLIPDRQTILDHFEDYCLLSIEQQLSPPEEKMLQQIIGNNTGKSREYFLYQSTILKADENILYPWKSRLKKRFINIPGVRIAAAAVAAAAVILLALLPLVRIARNQVADSEHLPVASEKAENSISLEDHPQIPSTDENVTDKAPVPPRKYETFPSPDPATRAAIEGNRLETIYPGSEQGSLMRASTQMAKLESIKAGTLQYSGRSIDPPLVNRNRVTDTDDYLRLDEYALLQLNRRIIKNRAEKKFSFWKLADAGMQRINDVSVEDYSLERETDDYGKTRRLTLETPVFGISAPLRAAYVPRE